MNLKNILVSAICLSLAACTSVIPKGEVVTSQREITEPFDRVEVSSGLHLSLVDEVNTTRIQVRAIENIHEYIETFVEDKTLIVRFRPNVVTLGIISNMEVFIPASVPKAIIASGGAEVLSRTTLRNPNIEINLSGGSQMTATVETNDLTCNLNGGSKLDLSGSTINCRLTLSGGSKSLGYGFSSESLRIFLEGGSKSEMTATRIMEEVNLSGGSEFLYDGNPSIDYNIVSIGGGAKMSRRH